MYQRKKRTNNFSSIACLAQNVLPLSVIYRAIAKPFIVYVSRLGKEKFSGHAVETRRRLSDTVLSSRLSDRTKHRTPTTRHEQLVSADRPHHARSCYGNGSKNPQRRRPHVVQLIKPGNATSDVRKKHLPGCALVLGGASVREALSPARRLSMSEGGECRDTSPCIVHWLCNITELFERLLFTFCYRILISTNG